LPFAEVGAEGTTVGPASTEDHGVIKFLLAFSHT
jgi:hypothetical protein